MTESEFMTNKEVGFLGEKIAALYLEKKGYTIMKRNFTVKGGEIDIIAKKDGFIAFVEVKTRSADFMSDGFSAVTEKKRRLIIRASEIYSLRYPHDLQPRFDVVQIILDGKKVIGFNYVENAFDASGIMTIL
jgi:putative endonuclease